MKNRSYVYPMEYETLNDGQREAFDRIVDGMPEGKPFFLTGNAGTGKSYLASCFARFCELNWIGLAKCAPTGIAAMSIGGTTMHKLFKLPLSVVPPELEASQKANVRTRLAFADVIFIDEISMARVDMLDCAMRQVYMANKIRASRGKRPVQVILCGDFGQLPPVITAKDRICYEELTGQPIGSGYCCNGSSWKYMNFEPVVLTEPMRQADVEFCRALDQVKLGCSDSLDYLNANTAQDPLENGIWICGRNETVLNRNKFCLEALPGKIHSSKAEVSGDADLKKTNLEQYLEFKTGARVVMLLNDQSRGLYCNGSLGTITDIRGRKVDIRMDNGRFATVLPATLEFYDYKVTDGQLERVCTGAVTQYPFKLGYAVTIHKSQGQTYDCANLIPEIFAPGQLYVALSRCRSVRSLYIQPDSSGEKLVPRHVMTDRAIKGFLAKTYAAAQVQAAC